MKRLLLFSHYNKYGYLSEHVIYLLDGVQKYFDKIVIISNSQLTTADKKRLSKFKPEIITRENVGYDFAAWQEGMIKVGAKELTSYESVTIMNDTCFGPVYSFDPVFDVMENKSLDFWGLVAHRWVSAVDSPSGKIVPKHLQSFFITFNRNVVKSEPFNRFWLGVQNHDNVDDVILKYETKLTKLLSDAGFKYDAFFDTSTVDAPGNRSVMAGANLTIYSPEICLDAKVPLVKIKAFTHHRYPRYLFDTVATNTKYPARIIQKYFNIYSDPNFQLILDNKLIDRTLQPTENGQSVAIHLHAFYMDIAEEFIERFSCWQFEFDLFITVSNDDLKAEIQTILANHNLLAKEIMVLRNRGYAVVPWITVANKFLNNYDIVGHFHTKKDAHMDRWIGEVWRHDLIDMLVDKAPQILGNFAANKQLGFVLPDIPRHARYLGAEMYYDQPGLREIIRQLIDRMDLDGDSKFNLDDTTAFIYPYGMMYWYRPAAIKPITDLEFSEREIPFGILPEETILHAIERIFVYVAWVQGFDYGIVQPSKYTSQFVDTIVANKLNFIRLLGAQTTYIGLKSTVKNRTKSALIRIAKPMPPSVRSVLMGAYHDFVIGRRVGDNLGEPSLKVFSHELSNTGAPRVAIDLIQEITKYSQIYKKLHPCLYIPEGSNVDNKIKRSIENDEISVRLFRPDNLLFAKGDIVILNTIAYGDTIFTIILDNLQKGIIEHLYIYPHEYTIDTYLSEYIAHKITKLAKAGKLTIFTSSVQTQKVYEDYFNIVGGVRLMPNRLDIPEDDIIHRPASDFREINFVVTGTPDARKGELDILYAFTSFYNFFYKGNEKKYRNFSLSIIGLTDSPQYIYNKLYSDRIRESAEGLGDHIKLFDQQPEDKTIGIINKCNFTILFSLYEALPRVVFFGLAAGHPLLRNDCSGYEEQLKDGVNGWKTKNNDWYGMVLAIEQILNKKATTNHELAKMSFESAKIAKRFTKAKYLVIEDIKKSLST